ncbi:MAG: GAF domain-containing protein [Chloroflexi bacterium]|nr:GAF domain-containing protein [Chloroflexota bacterium]
MVRFFSSLRFRLILLVLLAIVPSLGLVIYTASELRRAAANDAQERALEIAQEAAQDQQTLIESTRQFLSVLAQVPAVHNLNPDECNAFLAQFLQHYPRYTSITVRAAKDAASICRATAKNGPIPVEPGLAHLRAIEAQNFAIGDFMIGQTSGKPVLPFGYPIFDEANQVQAVIMVSLDLHALNQLVGQTTLPAGSTLMVNDSTGKVLARYPSSEAWVGQSAADAPVVKAILARKGEGTVEALGEDQVMRLYAFTPLTTAFSDSVYVSVGIPSDVAFHQVNQILIRALITLGLVAAFALAAAWFIGNWFVVHQVNTLVNFTGQLGKGDFGARVGAHYQVSEFEQLAQAFNEMCESLQQQEAARKQAEDAIRCWSTELERLMNAMSEAISQSLEVSKIAEISLTRTLSIMGLANGGVFLKHGDKLALVAKSGIGDEIIQNLSFTQPFRQTANEIENLEGQVTVQVFSTEIDRQMSRTELDGKSWICVPIKSKGRVFGVMCLICERERSLKEHEKRALAAVGQQIGVAMENAELYEQVQSIATLKERERLSRELHDGLAQVLGYLCIRNKATANLVASNEIKRAAAHLDEMQQTLDEAYQDVRESILGLRETISHQRNLFSSLKEYTSKFGRQTGIRVNLVSDGNIQKECTPDAEVQLLRIIQESLSNVRKHSRAKQTWIRFEQAQSSMRVTIEDDGKGFDLAAVARDTQSHFGLQTMRERAESVGGNFQVWSQLEQGTKIQVTLPCK